MLNKKAQGLSMNVIIIAAIALLILVILSVLILRTGREVTESKQCYAISGAQCISDAQYDNGCPPNWAHERSRDGEAGGCMEDELCCFPQVNE